MNVSLTQELESFVSSRVQSGRYNNASEVIRASLRLLEHEESLREEKLKLLKKEINKGMRQSKGGNSTSLNIDEIKKLGRQRLTPTT